MFGTKELKQAAETATLRLNELEPAIRQMQTVLARHETAMDNVVAITSDLRAITSALRAAIVREA